MSPNFIQAFTLLIGNEGKYVNDPNDPGGETKFGISKRQYPAVDIASLSLDEARAIYESDYWSRVRGDDLPFDTAFQVFDMAVNEGNVTAIKTLQNALKVDVDGVIGPATIAASQSADPLKLGVRFNAARLRTYTDMKQWQLFGRGWANRVATNLELLAA